MAKNRHGGAAGTNSIQRRGPMSGDDTLGAFISAFEATGDEDQACFEFAVIGQFFHNIY
jgi:hypothetical protein